MTHPPLADPPATDRKRFLAAAIVLTAAIIACSVYANLSYTVTAPAGYRFFPPFEADVNANENDHLGAGTEYAHIGKALLQGKGYADPFGRSTGPTAWMPPILPAFLAALYWLSNSNGNFVVWTVVVIQVLVIAGTGLLVLALVRQATSRIAPAVAALFFIAALLGDFRLSFQWTHDCWLVMLSLDLLIVGFCWFRPLHSWKTAIVWGLLGGLCTLVNPIVGFAWGAFSLVVGTREQAWRRLPVTALVAGLALTPWLGWNLWVFGKLIPVKSNLAYELYQSQCLQPDGLIRRPTFAQYPGGGGTREGKEYDALGEIAYLDRKREQFCKAVRADPAGFLDRVSARFIGATLWYVPFDPAHETGRPWMVWCSRLTHPLPFLALVVLLCFGIGDRLHWTQWVVVGVYLLYLLPYVFVSYYERYAFPLLGVKTLLVIFAVDRFYSLSSPIASAKESRSARPS